MSLSINIGRPFLNDKTLDEQARSVLRKFGTDAHVYLPGANGVAVSGLNSGNYVESTFSTLASVDSVVGGVRDPVGSIDATQATTANKPALRRGLYNLLLNSATPATQSVTCAASPYTLALYGTGSVTLSGTGSGTLNGTGASDLVVLNFTPTAGSVTFTKSGTVSSFGLFQGTLTAAQILAEGGIPLTTSAAASNPSAGRYSWQFDGVNDQLVCATAPFQIADDFAIVVAVNANTIAGFPGVLAVDDGGSTNAVALYLNSGVPTVYVMAGGTLQAATAGPTITAGSAYVLSIVKTGASLKIRKNGVDGTTVSTVGVGSAAFTAMRIGHQLVGLAYWDGAIGGGPMFIKGTVSDADLLTLERWVASLTPAGPTF